MFELTMPEMKNPKIIEIRCNKTNLNKIIKWTHSFNNLWRKSDVVKMVLKDFYDNDKSISHYTTRSDYHENQKYYYKNRKLYHKNKNILYMLK